MVEGGPTKTIAVYKLSAGATAPGEAVIFFDGLTAYLDTNGCDLTDCFCLPAQLPQGAALVITSKTATPVSGVVHFMQL